ncbi:CDP-6-deoxy-D-xylo-4-hexulose-3-dehydrase [Sphingomonas kyeonggiensis]|uniref:CDP-6-deoxy-D-xylo-4-hexulose-3-dehydrase n=1 Tax=Sphingomonas kyeonggiensis TaxID=1268553 RepID=A0A7W7K388_9SPHN|nr:DegT/DnrJ/EryC1/StrS family aminotransferase [Sphingomonas kyeonggiensis]MBB4839788.1 CDP-6-deoxy-D-xylo-4-hexulose-3-dehydrase [Sphingomonas kyeonggiensis]
MSFVFPLANSTWDEAEYQALQDVIASGHFTMGPKVQAFERAFADYLGANYSVMVNSGSSANLLMIAALFYTSDEKRRLKRGDEVIVPAVSWSTTYYPLHQYGLKMKFVDIDLETLNLDLDAVEAAIGPSTRAILAVNLLGNPNDFARLQKICDAHGLILLEDNCESLGAEVDGKQAGTFGLMGTYSCFFSHHISTMEGGMVSTDDEELYHILLSLRAHGWTRNLPRVNHICSDKSDDYFEEAFRFILPGYNLRPLEMSGALGICQVEKLPGLIAARRENGALLQAALSQHPDLMIQREIGKSSWFGFSLVVRPGRNLTRSRLLGALHAKGFECRPIVAGNFAAKEVVKYMDHEVHGRLAAADHVDAHGVFVGNHHYPIPDAIEALASLEI